MSVIHMSHEDFNKEIIENKKMALIDFSAVWCGPCKMLAPIIEDIAQSYEDKLLVGKIDIDESMALATGLGIFSVPTLIIYKDGKEMERVVGVRPFDEIEGLIKKYI